MAVGWTRRQDGFADGRGRVRRNEPWISLGLDERNRGVGGFSWRHRPQVERAIWAVFIVFRDFLLALRAGRMQVAFAIGAVIEAGANHFSALRAGVRKRLPHQEIENEADRKIG